MQHRSASASLHLLGDSQVNRRCTSLSQRGAWLVVSAVALLAGQSSAAPLAGRYASPLGNLLLKETQGEVRGTLLDATNACGWKKGALVLTGSRLDDSIVGSLRACKAGDGCSGDLQGAAMLLITKGGNVMSGAVHFDKGTCRSVLPADAVVLKKSAGVKSAATKVTPKSADGRSRAQAIAAAAYDIFKADGDAERLRAQLQSALEIDHEYAEGYVGVGMTFFVRERYDEALDWYKRALEANPTLGDAYYNTACVYAVRGDPEQALRYLRTAVLNGYVDTATLAEDEDLKNLAGNPAFEKLKSGVIEDAPAAPVTSPAPVAPLAPTAPAGSIDRPAGQ